MKEHGSKLPAEQPAKILKSLLKKPGQTRTKSQKNRVVINEKLNEFFAADYIILIKEECCTDYEEDCDCCCQEHELIRLGNCKECRAELNLHFGVTDNGDYDDIEKDEDVICENAVRGCVGERFDCVDLHVEDDEEEEDGLEGEQDDEDDELDRDHMGIYHGGLREADSELEAAPDPCETTETREATGEPGVTEDVEVVSKAESQEDQRHRKQLPEEERDRPIGEEKSESSTEQINRAIGSPGPAEQEQQQETLSPPEGYKDVCSNSEESEETEQHVQPSYAEPNYYHQLRSSTGAETRPKLDEAEKEPAAGRYAEEAQQRETEKVPARGRNEQLRQVTPTELHHRYLVETITMTTVTERRIVREISEEGKTTRYTEFDPGQGKSSCKPAENGTVAETATENDNLELGTSVETGTEAESMVRYSMNQETRTTTIECAEQSEDREDPENAKKKAVAVKEDSEEERSTQGEMPDVKELSLVFKLGSSSLATNSLKPNSAVRQLFPNPKFISPPPAPAGKTISAENSVEGAPNGQKFHITSENLRLFDVVKRSKDSDDENTEDESSFIKRTIERNTLRRSLIGKYHATTRKKNLRPKNLSLEERIRQLTCVDQEEENNQSDSTEVVGRIADSEIDTELMVRTSPSGEEQPANLFPQSTGTLVNVGPNPSVTAAGIPTTSTTTTTTITSTMTTGRTTIIAANSSIPMPTPAISLPSAYHKQNATIASLSTDNTQYQSTYKKLTDLFVHKKTVQQNLPDLGLGTGAGGKNALGKEYQSKSSLSKMNSDVRRQFLASLAPLSCVTVNSTDTQEDYYRHNSRIAVTGNRDSITYNSDSSYSLEDIEAALVAEEQRYAGQPDLTRGTPTGNRPDLTDSTTDELLAFIEQDKSRTERIKRRYDIEDRCTFLNGYAADDRIVDGRNVDNRYDDRVGDGESSTGTPGNGNNATGNNAAASGVGVNAEEEDDEDDELNDYGFNRRPSVRGIKPQATNNADNTHRPIQPRGIANTNFNGLRTNFQPQLPNYYDNSEDKTDSKLLSFDETGNNSTTDAYIGPIAADERDANTINRINTMQKQIDDIYQTIAESTANTQEALECDNYLENTFPRSYVRLPANETSIHLYSEQKNGHQYFQEQHNASNVRMLRVPTGAEEAGNPGYANNFPGKVRRREPAVTLSNYTCNVLPNTGTPSTAGAPKCYRTMYFVPYNGLSDPTYQNIQRILPPHSSPSYATHIERYPYPRVNKHETLHPHPHPHPLPQMQPQTRYYAPNHSLSPVSSLASVPVSATIVPNVNPVSSGQETIPTPGTAPHLPIAAPRLSTIAAQNALPLQAAQQTLHLHLHHHQPPEDFHISGVAFSSVPHAATHSLQLHHHQHHQHHRHRHQTIPYRMQNAVPVPSVAPPPSSTSSYTVITPTRPGAFAGNGPANNTHGSYHLYQVHLGRTIVEPSSEMQSQPFPSSVSASATSGSISFPTFCSSDSSSSSSSSTSSYSSSSSSSSSSVPTAGTAHPPVSHAPILPQHPNPEAVHPGSYDGPNVAGTNQSILNNVTSISSSSSSLPVVVSSPTKLHHQRMIAGYTVAERGVPEGAASVPSHDLSQIGTTSSSASHLLLTPNSYIGHNSSSGSLPSHTQNSVYYAMNV